jgi:DDE superfamily endonuclease
VENCQLGAFCAYVTGKGRALIDRELPKSWTEDRDRCREAAVPDDAVFATKTELARLMLGRALDAGVPAAWVTADEPYGKDCKFRDWLEQRRIGYVVAVAGNQAVPGSAGSSRAGVLAAHAPSQAWKRRKCGDGAKGPRMSGWAAASLPGDDSIPPGWSRHLLVRRALTRNGRGRARAGLLPDAGHAGARLSGSHGGDRPKSPGSGLIPVTLGEVRRLLAHLMTTIPAAPPRGPGPAGAAAISTTPKPATTSEDRPITTKCCWSSRSYVPVALDVAWLACC